MSEVFIFMQEARKWTCWHEHEMTMPTSTWNLEWSIWNNKNMRSTCMLWYAIDLISIWHKSMSIVTNLKTLSSEGISKPVSI